MTTLGLRIRLLSIAALLLTLVAGRDLIAKDLPPTSNPDATASKPGSAASLPKGKTFPGPPAVTARDPRVLLITAPDCEQCFRDLIKLRSPGGAFEAMRSRGWNIGVADYNHVQIVDRDAIPELIKEAQIREFPAVVCVSEGKVIRGFKTGCTTPLDAWTFGWLLTGKNERPAGFVPEPIRVRSTGSYRLRGNHWSVDGDWNPTQAVVLAHLRSPNHGYQVAASYKLESWSYEELRSLHDDLHEQELAMYPASRMSSGPTGADNYSAGRKQMGR